MPIYNYRITVPDKDAEIMGTTVFNAMKRMEETWRPDGVTITQEAGEGEQVLWHQELPLPAVEQDNTNP